MLTHNLYYNCTPQSDHQVQFLVYDMLGAIKQIEKIDMNNNSIEDEDIAAYGCQGGNGKEKIWDLIHIVCYITVESPIASQKSDRYQAIENFIRNLGNQKNHHSRRYEWSCRYF